MTMAVSRPAGVWMDQTDSYPSPSARQTRSTAPARVFPRAGMEAASLIAAIARARPGGRCVRRIGCGRQAATAHRVVPPPRAAAGSAYAAGCATLRWVRRRPVAAERTDRPSSCLTTFSIVRGRPGSLLRWRETLLILCQWRFVGPSSPNANNGGVIERIPGVRGAQAYLYESAEGLAVVDPGYTGSFRAVLRFLTERRLNPKDLGWVILTHHHIDHAGTAFALCEATGARLAVHRDDAPYLRAVRPRERMTFWGIADRLPTRLASYIVSCADGELRLLEHGDAVAGLSVVHGPGHTPGSICLWSASESALFLGDVLNNERGLRTPPWTVNHTHSMAKLAPQRLRELRYERAFFGHGPAVLANADQRIRAFVGREV